MEGKVAKGNRVTEESIFGQLLLFFFPVLFGTFFQQLYNTADAMVVGRFVGKQALAAMGGSTSTLINLLVGLFVGLSSGATVVISQFHGTREAGKIHWAVHTSIAFPVIGDIIFMIMGLVGLSWALEAMKTPEDVMGHTVVCIRIYFLSVIVDLIYNMGTGIPRAVGDSRWPLYFLITSYFTSIILDMLLVAVLRMGVAGAALVTITSQLLNAVLVVRALIKTGDMYKLGWEKVRIDQRILQRIVRIGIPAGMQSVMCNISNIIIRAGVNTLGADSVTAWATYGRVDGLYWMMTNTLGVFATAFVGQNFRAGHLGRVRKDTDAHMVIGIVLATPVEAVLYDDGHLLVELFTTDLQVQAISIDLLHLTVPTFITYIATGILSGALKGMGDAWVPLVITSIGVCVVKMLWIILVLPHYHTIIGAAFCYPLTWSLATVASMIYYYFFGSLRRWKLKPLKRQFGVYKPFWYGKTFCIK